MEFLDKTVLAANTPRAIVDKTRFHSELLEFRRLGINGHTPEITDQRMPEMLRKTTETAAQISLSLGSDGIVRMWILESEMTKKAMIRIDEAILTECRHRAILSR